jgi:GTPase SAR1 family protein
LTQNKLKFKEAVKKRIVIVGPARAGKTALFEAFVRGKPVAGGKSDEKTERAQLGLKVVNPKCVGRHPMAIRVVDTPAETRSLKRASKFAFRKVDLILVVIDSSIKLQ